MLDFPEVASKLINLQKTFMRKTLTILILGSMLSCQTKEKPKEVMSQAQLTAFLIDIYLAEAKLDGTPQIRDSTIKYFLPFEEKLLRKKGIPDSVLRITYSYYLSHPKELEQVYDSVIDSLTLREQRGNPAFNNQGKKGQKIIN